MYSLILYSILLNALVTVPTSSSVIISTGSISNFPLVTISAVAANLLNGSVILVVDTYTRRIVNEPTRTRIISDTFCEYSNMLIILLWLSALALNLRLFRVSIFVTRYCSYLTVF